MTVFIDVKSRLDSESAAQAAALATAAMREAIEQGTAQGVRDALEALMFGLSVTPDERQALEKYRNKKAADLRRARAAVAKAVNAGKAN